MASLLQNPRFLFTFGPGMSAGFVPQVGAVVEVKNPDGVYQEATINKLTDASIYTVGESVAVSRGWGGV